MADWEKDKGPNRTPTTPPRQYGYHTNRERAYDCANYSREAKEGPYPPLLRGLIYALCDVADAIRGPSDDEDS